MKIRRWLKHEVSSEFTLGLAKLNWKMRKVYAIIGIIAMLGSLLPQTSQIVVNADSYVEEDVLADKKDTVYSSTSDEEFDISEVSLVKEIEDLRTINTKTFLKEDGSFTVGIYGQAVHYKDSNGLFQNIDNSLAYSKEEDSYQNLSNDLKVKFPKTLDSNKKIKISLDEYEINFSILDIQKSNIEYSASENKSNNLKELSNIEQGLYIQTRLIMLIFNILFHLCL
ncbi:MAG: hypothetical protein JXR48_18910 [Candidatus Delongbacteria bacterium]|nr:hypothetical protein [Candidatus Delongbacteria bacterium]